MSGVSSAGRGGSARPAADGWRELIDAYRKEGLVLAIGAGVSKDSSVPTWEDLLRRIGKACLGPEGIGLVDRLKRERLTLPAVASVLRARCGSERCFTRHVRDALYRDFKPYRDLKALRLPAARASRGVWHRYRGQKLSMVLDATRSNRTLQAVAALCAVPAGSAYRRNPNIHAILNFNLDAIFRTYVEARYGQPLVRTVERASKEPGRDKISVYHAHGFLRFDGKAMRLQSESFDKVVLTEQNYFDFTNNPTGMFTYTFLHLLREHRCLFVGLSMQDDNIRRLLHYLRKERLAAYLEEVTSRPAERRRAEREAERSASRHFALMKSYGSRQVDDAVAESLRQLGVTVLWFDRFRAVPDLLARMYAANGGNWSRVYGRPVQP